MWNIRSLLVSATNLLKFAKVVWKFRWWDFSFQEEMIDKMLEKCENNWTDSHYVGAGFTLGRIKVVRRFYRRYQEAEEFLDEWKWQKKFHSEYGRLLHRLWD